MAEKSVNDSAAQANRRLSSRIVFTHVLDGYAVIRVPLCKSLLSCKAATIYDYLWSLSEAIEQVITQCEKAWFEKNKK